MIGPVTAIYEGGVLRLLQPVNLPEATRVTVTFAESDEGRSTRDWGIVERARAELAGRTNVPTIEEVRAILAAIPGNWADDIIADRGDY